MTAFAVSLVVTCVSAGILLPILHRTNVLDVPNARSSHAAPVPRGGGIAVVLGIVAAAVAVAGDLRQALLLAGLSLVMAVVGFIDDLGELSSRIRLVAQLLTGLAFTLVLVAAGQSTGWPTWLVASVLVIGFAAYVNAFNFMDGINGISALSGAVAGGWFLWVGTDRGLDALAVLGGACAGACLGFLPWNAPRARMFLGDVGSYALGSLIVSMSLYAWVKGVPVLVAAVPLLIYLADTAWALVHRARRREPLGEAHRGHVYQRLVDGGWRHLPTAAWVGLLSAGACLAAIVPIDVEPAKWLLVAAVLGVYLATPAIKNWLSATKESVR